MKVRPPLLSLETSRLNKLSEKTGLIIAFTLAFLGALFSKEFPLSVGIEYSWASLWVLAAFSWLYVSDPLMDQWVRRKFSCVIYLIHESDP